MRRNLLLYCWTKITEKCLICIFMTKLMLLSLTSFFRYCKMRLFWERLKHRVSVEICVIFQFSVSMH